MGSPVSPRAALSSPSGPLHLSKLPTHCRRAGDPSPHSPRRPWQHAHASLTPTTRQPRPQDPEALRPRRLGCWVCRGLVLPLPPVLLIVVTFHKDGPAPQSVDFQVEAGAPALLSTRCPGPGPDIYTPPPLPASRRSCLKFRADSPPPAADKDRRCSWLTAAHLRVRGPFWLGCGGAAHTRLRNPAVQVQKAPHCQDHGGCQPCTLLPGLQPPFLRGHPVPSSLPPCLPAMG